MTNSIIKTAHEETYSDGRSLGVLVNYRPFNENNVLDKINSFAYLYKEGMYIFFETIMEMNDYLLYGDRKIKRAYMKEHDFDNYYDNGLNTSFEEVLKWIE